MMLCENHTPNLVAHDDFKFIDILKIPKHKLKKNKIKYLPTEYSLEITPTTAMCLTRDYIIILILVLVGE